VKLEEAARKAIELLRVAGERGIDNIELAQKLKVPKRRIYDIVNPLKPLGLIAVKKEKGKTKIYWLGEREALLKPGRREKPEEVSLRIETVKLKERDEITEMVSAEPREEGIKFNCSVLKISCDNPSKSCRVYHDGFEVVVETDGEGLVVKPESQREKTPKIQTIL